MKKYPVLLFAVLAVACAFLCEAGALAATTKYWRLSTAASGSAGGSAPAGNWDVSTLNWDTTSTGTGSHVAFVSGDNAVFSAASDATGTFTITMPSALSAGSVTVEEGTVTKSSAALTTQTISVNSGATFLYANSGGIVSSAGATCTLNGGTFGYTAGGAGGTFLTANMGIVLNGGGILSDAIGNPNVYSGVISGTGDLTKVGAGILAITTTCTYSGNTIVNNGVLRLRTGSPQIPNTALIVTSPGGFDAATFTQTIQSLSGTGNLPFSGGGTLTVSGNSSTVLSGVMSGSGILAVAGGTTLNLRGINTLSGQVLVSGTGGINVSSGGALCGSAADVQVNGGTLSLTNAAQTVEDFGGTGGTVILNNGVTLTTTGTFVATGRTTNYTGVITGPGNLNVAAGIQTLSGPNTYTGTTTVQSGAALKVFNSSALGGSATGTTVNSGGGVQIGGAVTVPEPLTLSGTGTNNDGALRSTAGANAWTGPITLGATGVRINSDANNITLSGGISGPGFNLTIGGAGSVTIGTAQLNLGSTGDLTKDGGGTLTLNIGNTYRNTIINGGVIAVNASADSELGSATGTLTLNGGTLRDTATATLSSTRNIVLNGTGGTFDVTPSQTLTYGGIITGAVNTAGLSKITSGTLTLSGANTFGGGTGGDFTISAGTVNFNNDRAAGLGKIIVSPTSAVTLRNSVTATTITNAITLNNIGPALDIFATSGNSLTINGQLTGAKPVSRGSGGGIGILTLNGDNSGWSGGMSLLQGPLVLGHKNALGTGPLTVTPGASAPSLGANTALTGPNAVANAVALNGDLTIASGSDLELSGNVVLGGATRALTNNNSVTTLSGVVSGDPGAGLSKSGSGKLILGNIGNAYSGPTTVNAGTLLVNGSIASGSAVSVNSGATFGGTGAIGGAVTVNSGGTLAPGASIGTLTLSVSPTLNGTTSMEIDRGATPNADKLVVVNGGGTLAYGGILTVANLGAVLQLNDTFDLFDADAFSASFATVNLPTLTTGLAWDTSQLGVDGTIKVVCSGTLAANAGANTNICAGGSAQLNASASGGSGTGYTFSWSPAAGLSSTSISNPVASPGITTTYTVTATDLGGCTAQSSVTVSLDGAPMITAQPANTTVCSGTAATFSVGATGSGLMYSWAKHNNGGWGSAWSTSGSGATFRQTSTQNNFGDGACTGFSSASDINSPSGNALAMWGGFSGDEAATRDFAALSAGQAVSVDFDNGNVDSGSKVGFSLQDSGGSDVLQFYFVGGQANYKYWDTASAEQDTGMGFQRTGLRVQFILLPGSTYKLIVTACGGSSNTFTGSYSGTISRLKLFNQNNTGGDDKNIYFNNFIAGGYMDNADNYSGDYAGQDKGDQPILTGNGGSSYTTPILTTADSGAQYEVVVYGCSGTVLSSAATLTVNPVATVNAGPDQTVCADSPAATLAGSFGGAAMSAAWSTAGTGTFDDTNALTAVYTPGGADINAGSVTLTLTTDDPSGPCGPVSDSMVVTFDRVTATNMTFVRPASSPLKISKTNLLAQAADSAAETLTLTGVGTDGVNLLTTNGATLSADANWIYYTNSVTPSVNDSFAYKVTNARGCVALGMVLINVLQNETGLSTGISISNGVATVDFAGIPGRSYEVQRSTNLVDWATLVTTNAPAGGVFHWVDDFSDLGVPPTDPPSSAYYRLRVP